MKQTFNHKYQKSIQLKISIMAFNELKLACKGGVKYKKFDDLPLGEHEIKSFMLRSAKYGDCVSVFIEDFYLILPDRFTQVIGQKRKIEEMNAGKYILIWKGKIGSGKEAQLDIDFEEIKEPNPKFYNEK